jgi:hypothetical protein
MPRTQTLPARIYSTPEYRKGYEAGCKAARAQGPQENPYLPQDLRHLGWADACYDNWSARRVEFDRVSVSREEFHPKTIANAFAS